MKIDDLEFSQNWNNKLDCDFYTAIRMRNDKRYFVGKRFRVLLKGKEIHHAEIVKGSHFKIYHLNSFITYLDSGYPVMEFISMFKKMYSKKNIDWETDEIVFVLLKKIKE